MYGLKIVKALRNAGKKLIYTNGHINTQNTCKTHDDMNTNQYILNQGKLKTF